MLDLCKHLPGEGRAKPFEIAHQCSDAEYVHGVADIYRNREALLGMQCRQPPPEEASIFNVIVNEKGVMK